MSAFRSFQDTPILLLTEQIRPRCTPPPRVALAAILRDVWLGLTWRDGWFVGPYWVLPDRVSLFACAGSAACAAGLWTARWKQAAVKRMDRIAGGWTVEWASGLAPVPMTSEPDYRASLQALAAETMLLSGGRLDASDSGVLWQLL